MSVTTIDDITALADVPQCLKEIGITSTTANAHNMLAWLAIKILQKDLSKDGLSLCRGTLHGKKHSWFAVESPNESTPLIVDMASPKFASQRKPYVGTESNGYTRQSSVRLTESDDDIMEFLLDIGNKPDKK